MAAAVRDNPDRSRFELEADGVTAFMNYRLTGHVISLDHTETPAAARRRGLASQLVKGALDDVRSRGLKILPRCPFVRAYVASTRNTAISSPEARSAHSRASGTLIWVATHKTGPPFRADERVVALLAFYRHKLR
jgi:uncharacterized protein